MDASDIGEKTAQEIMLEFAEKTGLQPAGASPERYLWTDAFAVCNFLGLYRRTGDKQYRRLALLLVDQVHAVLGRHRRDDDRAGWISGIDEEEGRKHPTKGGLRIGKRMGERKPDEPFDERLEWDRDGQYFHYLTQWMHALSCVSRFTGDPTFNSWAMELAKTAHVKFSYLPRKGGGKRFYWKMSIDLSYPLVSSMGHHDPLDGLITYCELQKTAEKMPGPPASRDLGDEIADMTAICEGKDWATDDPLGIGGLLTSAYRMAELALTGGFSHRDILKAVIEDCLRSLQYFDKGTLSMPADYRLAFREFGLSIGLQAIQKLQSSIGRYADDFRNTLDRSFIEGIMQYYPLSGGINTFWLQTKNRESANWVEHRNINMVMLATSLAPDGYLTGIT